MPTDPTRIEAIRARLEAAKRWTIVERIEGVHWTDFEVRDDAGNKATRMSISDFDTIRSPDANPFAWVKLATHAPEDLRWALAELERLGRALQDAVVWMADGSDECPCDALQCEPEGCALCRARAALDYDGEET